MYTLKQLPEDFVVRERSAIQLEKNGNYTYFLLKKRNLNTINALQLIAKKVNIDFKRFGFAGNKDKRAVTEQICSVAMANSSLIDLSMKNLKTQYLGRGTIPVSLGMLEGNYFDITIRNLEPKVKIIPLNSFINYFGEQRFGSTNAEVGRALVKRNFERACMIADQDVVKEYLQAHPANFIGALRRLPKKLVKFYICSYQSLLWNALIKDIITEGQLPLPEEAPIVGFGTEITASALKEKIVVLMNAENISFRDFIIKEIPEISSEGSFRRIIAPVAELAVGKIGDDNLNSHKKKCKISFFLQKGCYATEFIQQLMNNPA